MVISEVYSDSLIFLLFCDHCQLDWLDWTIIFSLDWTRLKNFSLVLDFWDQTVKRSPLFDGTRLYMVQS